MQRSEDVAQVTGVPARTIVFQLVSEVTWIFLVATRSQVLTRSNGTIWLNELNELTLLSCLRRWSRIQLLSVLDHAGVGLISNFYLSELVLTSVLYIWVELTSISNLFRLSLSLYWTWLSWADLCTGSVWVEHDLRIKPWLSWAYFCTGPVWVKLTSFLDLTELNWFLYQTCPSWTPF